MAGVGQVDATRVASWSYHNKFDGYVGFYSAAPVAQPTVAGVLSAVLDANAKAVLTSIIAALKNVGGVNLVIDGTT